MENIKTALYAEVKALSPLFSEYAGNTKNDLSLSISNRRDATDQDAGFKYESETFRKNRIAISNLGFRIREDKKSPTGYSLNFSFRPDEISQSTLVFDSTTTLEDLRSWGFALPFDLDVKAFVANVIKPVVDEFLSKMQTGETETETPTPEPTPLDTEAETAISSKEYRYAMVNRPAGLSTAPKGFLRLEERPPTGSPHYATARNGVVVYDHKLTDAETKQYEMSPMVDGDDMREYADNIANEMKAYAKQYLELASDDPADFVDNVKRRIEKSTAGYRPSFGDINQLAGMVKDKLVAGIKPAVEPVIEPITPIEPVQNETAEIDYSEKLLSVYERISKMSKSDFIKQVYNGNIDVPNGNKYASWLVQLIEETDDIENKADLMKELERDLSKIHDEAEVFALVTQKFTPDAPLRVPSQNVDTGERRREIYQDKLLAKQARLEAGKNDNTDIEAEIESLKQLIGMPEFSDALDALLDKLEAAGLDSQYETVVSDIIIQDAQAESAKVGV